MNFILKITFEVLNNIFFPNFTFLTLLSTFVDLVLSYTEISVHREFDLPFLCGLSRTLLLGDRGGVQPRFAFTLNVKF